MYRLCIFLSSIFNRIHILLIELRMTTLLIQKFDDDDDDDDVVRVFTIRSISRLPVVRFAIARLRNHLEIVRPLWLVVDRDVYEHCSCKQCVLIVFECHGQPHVCCLLIYKYTFYWKYKQWQIGGSYPWMRLQKVSRHRRHPRCWNRKSMPLWYNIWRTHQLKLMHIWNTGWNKKSSNWWPFQNPENALGPSRDCPKSWNGPTISRWLGRFRILKMPMGNLEIAPNPENVRNNDTYATVSGRRTKMVRIFSITCRQIGTILRKTLQIILRHRIKCLHS